MKTIKQNTLFDLVNKKTKPTVSTDKNIAFVKSVIPIIDEKEDRFVFYPTAAFFALMKEQPAAQP